MAKMGRMWRWVAATWGGVRGTAELSTDCHPAGRWAAAPLRHGSCMTCPGGTRNSNLSQESLGRRRLGNLGVK